MSEEIAPSDLANRENTMGHSHSQTSLEIRKLNKKSQSYNQVVILNARIVSEQLPPDDFTVNIVCSMPKPRYQCVEIG